MTEYRDSHQRTLADYPHPSVAVDTAVLTVPDDGTLRVLLVRSGDAWRLPGTFLHEGERLADAVLRSLRVKAGVTGLSPRQLHVFDDPHRDDRGWVLSVAHLDAVPASRLQIDEQNARLVPMTDVPTLPYGHQEIIALAVQTLRTDYTGLPDPAGLLAEPFTLRDLQGLHESVAGASLPRDTFRRAMQPLLRPTGGTLQGVVGKPPQLFVRVN
jgi:8-oxo-dGTP diphosphatase